jgi:hypothetical protein
MFRITTLFILGRNSTNVCQRMMINKMWCIHVVEYYSALKKKILIHITTWMNLKDIMVSEISKTQKDNYCMVPFVQGT